MAAIITEQFRKEAANILLDDIQSSSNYYIGIGQQDAWDDAILAGAAAPYPAGTYTDETRAIEHMTGLFRVTNSNTSLVVPKVDLESGIEYKVYNPTDPTCFYEDLGANLRPCYAMTDPDHIFLCIEKTVAATTMGDISSFGSGGFNDYGISAEISGYTWVYLGRYDRYNDINTNTFVAVSSAFDASIDTEASSASVLADPAGLNNSIIFTATTAGAAGNDLRVELVESVASPPTFALSEATALGITTVTIDYVAGTTASALIALINAGSPAPSVTAAPSGLVTGVVAAVGPLALTGGGTTPGVIKEATGGLVYGFKVLDGGSGYFRTGQSSGVETASSIAINLVGVDENNNLKNVASTASITYDNALQTISAIVLTDPISTGTLGFTKCKVELTGWTLGNGYTAPSARADEVVVLPFIAPNEGFGFDKTQTLPAWYIGIYGDTALADYVPALTDYKQITLVKNPLDTNAVPITATFAQPLGWFELYAEDDTDEIDNPLAVTPGMRLTQNGIDVGYLSHKQTVDDGGNALSPYRYYYIQDHKFGYTPVTTESASGNEITFETLDEVTSIVSATEPTAVFPSEDYLSGSGTVVFQDNRSGITREEGQNEELKCVIQL